MAILAALITASVALTVPFITFYLNKAPPVVPNGQATHGNVPISISWSARFLIVIVMALVFWVPVGFIAFCVAVVANMVLGPVGQNDLFLISLDAGLTSGTVFSLSLIWHAALNEPVKLWVSMKWYQVMMVAFFSALGFMLAFLGNAIWAVAHGLSLGQVSIFHDSADAAIGSGVLAWLAGFATLKIEELRAAPSPAPAR
jgi:hypothetical protein